MSNLVTPGQPAAPQDGPEGVQGQNGFQGQFGPATSAGQPPVPPPPPPAPTKTRPTGKIIVWAVIAVLIVAVMGWRAYDSLSSPAHAEVGDCLKGTAIASETATDVNDFKTVACTSSEAKYKVVGKVDGKTESEFENDQNLCAKFDEATAAFWEGQTGQKGYVLCLGDVH